MTWTPNFCIIHLFDLGHHQFVKISIAKELVDKRHKWATDLEKPLSSAKSKFTKYVAYRKEKLEWQLLFHKDWISAKKLKKLDIGKPNLDIDFPENIKLNEVVLMYWTPLVGLRRRSKMNEVTCHFIHRPLRSHRKGAVQIGLFVFRIFLSPEKWGRRKGAQSAFSLTVFSEVRET